MARQIRACIQRSALKHNYQIACNSAPGSQAMAVVKGDAYGHGLEGVVETLDDMVPAYAVATIDEGLQLRRISGKPILVLEGVLRVDELIEATHHRLTLMVHHSSQLALIKETPLHQPIQLWLKQDSGMHRLGLSAETIITAVSELDALAWVDKELVIAAHFANAATPEDPTNQLQRQALLSLQKKLSTPVKMSLANSAAILADPASHLDWNRPGIMLYGGAPFDDINHELAKNLRPVMSLESEVLAIRNVAAGEAVGYGATWTATRPSKIATVAIGYADGYPRHAPAGTPVAINDQLGKVVGRVSMDMIGVDVTDLTSVSVGAAVELWGNTVSVNTIAELSGTISYELTCQVTPRVPRILVD